MFSRKDSTVTLDSIESYLKKESLKEIPKSNDIKKVEELDLTECFFIKSNKSIPQEICEPKNSKKSNIIPVLEDRIPGKDILWLGGVL